MEGLARGLMADLPLYGGIEAGGTKFVCALGTGPDDIRAITQFATGAPQDTLSRAISFFRAQPALPAAIGIGSFGPVDPRGSSATYGYITATPKPGWSDTDVAGTIHRALGVPVTFDTDVNAAALGEHRWGAARDMHTFLYLTIGTGIGGGAIVHGRRLHGLAHPEMGHVFVPRAEGDDFEGLCPFHGACLEGLATGGAIAARWGHPASELPADHPAWELEAHYLAIAIVGFVLTLSPQRVILGGGVMHQSQLFPLIRAAVRARLNGYIRHPETMDDIHRYIVGPTLGDMAGVLGSIALAAEGPSPLDAS